MQIPCPELNYQPHCYSCRYGSGWRGCRDKIKCNSRRGMREPTLRVFPAELHYLPWDKIQLVTSLSLVLAVFFHYWWGKIKFNIGESLGESYHRIEINDDALHCKNVETLVAYSAKTKKEKPFVTWMKLIRITGKGVETFP